ncbi:MAG: ABC transporter substrate-binding protein, partial [Bacteroidia bacterium]|nr:ABC transporter substrate-binding protein [Bacteroidia bacterium]
FIQSKQTELLEFIQGKLDVFTGLESSFKDEILTGEGELKEKYASTIVLKKTPFLNTEYLAFNLEDKESPIHNIEFRRAMSYAVNRKSMIKYLRNNVGIPANGGFTPIGLPAHYSSSEVGYNPIKAKEHLIKSGIKQTKPIVLATTRDYLDLCVLVQKNLAEVGIEIKIDVIPSSLLKQQKSAGDLAFFRSSWIADYPDGENYMACFYSKNKAPNGPNYTRYSNVTFDQLYAGLLTETDPEKRKNTFFEMEQLLENNCPFILLFYDQSIWLYNKEIHNLRVNSLNHLDLRMVRKE